jgi:hypothetical protein
MTEVAASTQTTTDAGTPATGAAASATQDSGNQPAVTEQPTGDAAKDSAEDAPAQGADQADTDKADQPDQSSENQEPTDTNKDADGQEGEDGDQAQTAYQDFNMPEGLELDQDALNEALPVLQEHKLPQEAAQKLIDVASSMLSKAAKKMADDHNKVVKAWEAETIETFGKDGDAKFQESVGRANEVVRHFFNEEQRNVLTHYGFGNHPAFFAMCMAIAEGTGEDRHNMPSAGNGLKGEKTLGELWYPNSQT